MNEQCEETYPFGGWRHGCRCQKPAGHEGAHLSTFPGGSDAWEALDEE